MTKEAGDLIRNGIYVLGTIIHRDRFHDGTDRTVQIYFPAELFSQQVKKLPAHDYPADRPGTVCDSHDYQLRLCSQCVRQFADTGSSVDIHTIAGKLPYNFFLMQVTCNIF